MSLAWMVSRIKHSAETSRERICFCITFGRENLMVGIPENQMAYFRLDCKAFFWKFFGSDRLPPCCSDSAFLHCFVWPSASRKPTKWMPLVGDIMKRFRERANSVA